MKIKINKKKLKFQKNLTNLKPFFFLIDTKKLFFFSKKSENFKNIRFAPRNKKCYPLTAL